MLKDVGDLVEEYVERDPIYPSSLPERFKRLAVLTGLLEGCCETDNRDKTKEAAIRTILNEMIVECTRFTSGLDDDKEIILTELKEDICEAIF